MNPAIPPAAGRRTLLNAAALTGSNLWRIVISFLLQILVARRLGLEALGHYTVLMAVLNIGQVLSEAGMPLLMVREMARRPDLRRAYLRHTAQIQLAAALLTAAGLVASTLLLPNASPLRPALWWIAASFPFYALLSACETLFQAAERMELVLSVEGAINLLTLAASIGVLWQQGSVVQLAAVVALAQVVSVVLAAWLVARGHFFAAPQTPQTNVPITTGSLVRQARPFFGLALADVLLQRLDILLVSLVGGATAAGLYGAAYALLRVAVKIIQSVWRALYPTLSRLSIQNPARAAELAGASLRYGLLIGVGLAGVGLAVALDLVVLVYGADFPGSAPALGILLWTMPLFWVETAAVTDLLVSQRTRAGLAVTAAHVAALALLLPLGTWAGGAVGAAWAALAAQIVGAGVGMAQLPAARWMALARRSWPVLPAALAAYGVTVALPGLWPLRAGAGLATYALVLLAGRAVTLDEIRRMGKNEGR